MVTVILDGERVGSLSLQLIIGRVDLVMGELRNGFLSASEG